MATSTDAFVARAASQLGYYAKPGSNNKYGVWYGIPNGSWCAMFLSWVADQLGALDIFPKHAWTPSGPAWFAGRGQWHNGLAGVRRGDIVYFDFPDNTRRIQHVGLVESVNSDGSVNTIEGNTSGVGSQSNGGALMRKRRKSYIVGYGRPAYSSAAPEIDSRPKNADGSLTIAQDGEEGAQTISRWQEVMGTPIDGVIDDVSSLIKADQEFLNSVVSNNDIRNLTGKIQLDVDGERGRKTDIVRQYWLRNAMNPQHQKNLIGHLLEFDGDWGRESTLVLQFALNNTTSGSKQYGRV